MVFPPLVFNITFYLIGLIDVLLIFWARPGVLLIGSDGQLGSDDPRYVAEVENNSIALLRMNLVPQRGLGEQPPENAFGGANVQMIHLT